MKQSLTCINCPIGCRMDVILSGTGAFLSVSGNSCPRGAVYARQECTMPERMITAVIPIIGSHTPLSVKTSVPVPKVLIPAVMEKLIHVHVTPPVYMGQVILSDVLNTGADIVATRSIMNE